MANGLRAKPTAMLVPMCSRSVAVALEPAPETS